MNTSIRKPVVTITGQDPQGSELKKIIFDPDRHDNLLAALQANGFAIPAVCGGAGSCGKCKVKLLGGILEANSADKAYFEKAGMDASWRLACFAQPESDISVFVPDSGESSIASVDTFTQNIYELDTCAEALYAIAIDIGTTTIALGLLNLRTGAMTGRYSMVNRQREFGADVISRIKRANEGELSALSKCVRAQIAGGVRALCDQNKVDMSAVCKVAIAANTTMIHLLLELSCETLGAYPFTPVTLDFVSRHYEELFDSALSCGVTILPGISTYVGADITAGILFSKIYQSKNELFIDIGTNGEMALVASGKIFCAATAAGPAFEGGNIRWGTGSVPGAISHVRFDGGKFIVKTIEDAPPTGICGSGVVDAVWEGLKNGFILESGKLDKKATGGDAISLARTVDGEAIELTQKDIRELQLAKSAICSGIEVMLKHAGLKAEEINTLYIAGGFGYNLDFSGGAGIGLIPKALLSKVRVIGNSALGGAVQYLLNKKSEDELHLITGLAEEVSLSGGAYFNELFLKNIDFTPEEDKKNDE